MQMKKRRQAGKSNEVRLAERQIKYLVDELHWNYQTVAENIGFSDNWVRSVYHGYKKHFRSDTGPKVGAWLETMPDNLRPPAVIAVHPMLDITDIQKRDEEIAKLKEHEQWQRNIIREYEGEIRMLRDKLELMDDREAEVRNLLRRLEESNVLLAHYRNNT